MLENIYTADFETTTRQNYLIDGEVRVWLWSLVNISTKEKYYGYTIHDFFKTVLRLHCKMIYFHNLAFDGSFMVYYWLTHGEKFDSLIDGKMNLWYQLKWRGIEFRDSLKKFPESGVEDVANFIGKPGKYIKPDFNRYLPWDYIPSLEEIEYCIQDSSIMSDAMEREYSVGHNRLTLSSDAFKDLKNSIPHFDFLFPHLSLGCDSEIRPSYKGGIVYLQPMYKSQIIEDCYVYDINSMYTHVMRNCMLPYGAPFYREPEKNEYYFVSFRTEFYLKDKKIPTIQIKRNAAYDPKQYLDESYGEVKLTLSKTDYELFKQQYDVEYEYDHEYISFNQRTGILADYLDRIMEIKVKASLPESRDEYLRFIAKRYMNSPYGKFGMDPNKENVIPMLNPKGFISMRDQTEDEKKNNREPKANHVAFASAITSHARAITVNAAQQNYDNFIYCDTDSIHLTKPAKGIEMHKTELGKWDFEGQFPLAKYLGTKLYAHFDENKNVIEVKGASMTPDVKKHITYDNFKFGTILPGKRMKRMVPGGYLIEETTHEISLPKEFEGLFNDV